MSAARSVSFPFNPSSAQPAEQTAVLDRKFERQFYIEAVSVLRDSDFDSAVMAVYSYRPERELPRAEDSRTRHRRYLIPE
jgi:hypothetical protein